MNSLHALPGVLHHLFFDSNKDAKDFQLIIWQYNKAFAFTSSGGLWQLDGTVFNGKGPMTFKIQGEMYHQIGPFEPDCSGAHLYNQLYILDPNEALQMMHE